MFGIPVPLQYKFDNFKHTLSVGICVGIVDEETFTELILMDINTMILHLVCILQMKSAIIYYFAMLC